MLDGGIEDGGEDSELEDEVKAGVGKGEMTAVGAVQTDGGQSFTGGSQAIRQQIDAIQGPGFHAQTEHFQEHAPGAAANLEDTLTLQGIEIMGAQQIGKRPLALLNGKLVLSTSNLEEACLELLDLAHADHFELITMFYGEDLARTEVNRIVDSIRAAYPEQEIEVQEGCQPHYHFIIAIE